MIGEAEALLVCPQCSVALQGEQAGLRCPSCGESWARVNGVPHFIENFPYWGEIPQNLMHEVIQAAQSGSWKAALLDHPDPRVQRAAVMVLNLARANGHLLANRSPDIRVLDVGAGMGTNSHALATYYREVVAVEPVKERIEFMQQRFAQEGLTNVRILRSSLWKLPFPPESFGMVFMNGVLEWVAEGGTEDPEETQLSALRKVGAVLEPGGCLYLGIENRYCPGYFVGYPDPHSGVPFVTVMPRWLAHWYSRRKGMKNGYRNYLYSSRGYRKLLQRAGFGRVEIYLALPSYNHPRFLIPIEGDTFSYYKNNFRSGRPGRLRDSVRQLLLKLKLMKYTEYSYVIVAHKEKSA